MNRKLDMQLENEIARLAKTHGTSCYEIQRTKEEIEKEGRETLQVKVFNQRYDRVLQRKSCTSLRNSAAISTRNLQSVSDVDDLDSIDQGVGEIFETSDRERLSQNSRGESLLASRSKSEEAKTDNIIENIQPDSPIEDREKNKISILEKVKPVTSHAVGRKQSEKNMLENSKPLTSHDVKRKSNRIIISRQGKRSSLIPNKSRLNPTPPDSLPLVKRKDPISIQKPIKNLSPQNGAHPAKRIADEEVLPRRGEMVTSNEDKSGFYDNQSEVDERNKSAPSIQTRGKTQRRSGYSSKTNNPLTPAVDPSVFEKKNNYFRYFIRSSYAFNRDLIKQPSSAATKLGGVDLMQLYPNARYADSISIAATKYQ